MRILHTSDWHLGHTLYNYDRTVEHTAMLNQMKEIVTKYQPDVFLLCGDVYHTAQPSAAVQTLFTNAMVKIHQANPNMVIVITAGNHDSGSKHEIFRTPWKALNVSVIGTIDRDNLDDHIIEIHEKGFIVAVPYANGRNIPDGFFTQLLDMVNERNVDRLPVVLSAHTTVQGCDFTGHEHSNEYTVGGIDALKVDDFGENYDYLALGHIHREQFVHTGKHNVRYCGTPIPVTFDEHFRHSVSLVEIGNHGERPSVTEIEIQNPHPLVTLPGNGDFVSWDKAQELLREFDEDIAAYIRLNVEVEDFLPVEAHAVANKLTVNKKCRFCYINARRPVSKKREENVLSIQELQSEKPIDIAKRFADDSGRPFDAEMMDVFNQVLQSLQEDATK